MKEDLKGHKRNKGSEKCLHAGDPPTGNLKDNNKREEGGRIYFIGCACLDFCLPSSRADSKAGRQTTATRMRYNYHVPVSSYTRTSQYTPTYHTPTYYSPSHYTPTHYTPTHYTPTHHTSTSTSTSKYTPGQYSTTHYAPSHYAPSYRSASARVPAPSKGSRCSAALRTPVISPAPVKRTVHFPNDIIFQDIVRRGDLEQIGRFMRARKVRVDVLFHSGEQSLCGARGSEKCSEVLEECRWLMWSCVQVWQRCMKPC